MALSRWASAVVVRSPNQWIKLARREAAGKSALVRCNRADVETVAPGGAADCEWEPSGEPREELR